MQNMALILDQFNQSLATERKLKHIFVANCFKSFIRVDLGLQFPLTCCHFFNFVFPPHLAYF